MKEYSAVSAPEHRNRQVVYYLEQVSGQLVTLNEDGSVSSTEEQSVEVERTQPTRVPERRRYVSTTMTMLGKKATYASARDYIAATVDRTEHANSYRDYTWQLDDFPQEVRERYQNWSDPRQADIERSALIAAAHDMVVANDERESAEMKCPDCPDDPQYKYACHTSGWSRYFYQYPHIDVAVDEKEILAPLDIAAVIAAQPDVLQIDFERFTDGHQRMQGNKWLVVDMAKLPASYFAPNASGFAVIHNSDKLNRSIRVLVEAWHEDSGVVEGKAFSSLSTNDEKTLVARKHIDDLQRKIALIAAEVKETRDYNADYEKVIAILAKKGLTLFYEYAYVGMGETESVYKVGRPDAKGLYSCFLPTVAMSIDVREGAKDILDRLGSIDRIERDSASNAHVE
jgi:hypothetical protein